MVNYTVHGDWKSLKKGDQLGFEPTTFCILGRCSYYEATGTPWQWSRRQAIYSYTVALVYIGTTCVVANHSCFPLPHLQHEF